MNGYRYMLVGTDATTISELAANGFVLTNISTDGGLAIIDDHGVTIPVLSSYPSKPSYLLEVIDLKNMNQSEARIVQAYSATTNGNTNGYRFNTKGT